MLTAITGVLSATRRDGSHSFPVLLMVDPVIALGISTSVQQFPITMNVDPVVALGISTSVQQFPVNMLVDPVVALGSATPQQFPILLY